MFMFYTKVFIARFVGFCWVHFAKLKRNPDRIPQKSHVWKAQKGNRIFPASEMANASRGPERILSLAWLRLGI